MLVYCRFEINWFVQSIVWLCLNAKVLVAVQAFSLLLIWSLGNRFVSESYKNVLSDSNVEEVYGEGFKHFR